jgi:pSer/pThr/pTyr-binding forkhead associated (FHA) protein
MKSFPVTPGQVSSKPGTDQEPAAVEQTLLRSRPGTDQELADVEQTLLRPKLSMGQVAPESATIYAVLDIQQNEQVVQRLTIRENNVLVGRVDPQRSITPEIDLTQFDTSSSVSRQHARIRLEKTLFYIEDLQSRNKTRLGESTLTPHQPEVLQNGDVVSFGSVKATFRLLGTSELPVPWSQS